MAAVVAPAVVICLNSLENRLRSKAAVVKKSKSKKRSGFLGARKWRKDEERKRDRNPQVKSLQFVGPIVMSEATAIVQRTPLCEAPC